MNLELTGKIALITGSTAGIGFAIAKSLASEGAHVYVNGRTQERVNAAMAMVGVRIAGQNHGVGLNSQHPPRRGKELSEVSWTIDSQVDRTFPIGVFLIRAAQKSL